MNVMAPVMPDEVRPLEFSGSSGSYLGMALVNLLLTVVTFGIYRFWAKTKVRRYLWERTSFHGEALEYRGRGIEKFLGALLVFAVLAVPLFGITLIAAVLTKGGQPLSAMALYIGLYIGLIWLLGVGIYRSQRYMFSRTSWRGIRGGMAGGGWRFGLLYLGMVLLQFVTIGFASPYTTTRLWNARMNDAMFGSVPVSATAAWRPLFGTFLLSWIGAIAVYAITIALLFTRFADVIARFKPGAASPPAPGAVMGDLLTLYGVFILAGIVIALIMLRYHAAMLRELFARTQLGTMGFDLSVSARELLLFYLGNIAIVALTLGLGAVMMPYRIWSFYVRRLATVGHFDVDAMLQTSLAAPVQGDGLADAFDVSPF